MSTTTKPQDEAIYVGVTYQLRHARFGKATVKIKAINGEWIDTEIVAGKLVGMCDEWHPGDDKTVRRDHCTFTPMKR